MRRSKASRGLRKLEGAGVLLRQARRYTAASYGETLKGRETSREEPT
jgi:hypothetical protein